MFCTPTSHGGDFLWLRPRQRVAMSSLWIWAAQWFRVIFQVLVFLGEENRNLGH